MKHTIKLLTLAAILTAVFGLTGCPGPVNNYIEPHTNTYSVNGVIGKLKLLQLAQKTVQRKELVLVLVVKLKKKLQ